MNEIVTQSQDRAAKLARESKPLPRVILLRWRIFPVVDNPDYATPRWLNPDFAWLAGNVTFDDTKRKATDCYHHLRAKEMGPIPEFVASMGWFYKFEGRHAFRNVRHTGESRSAEADAAALFPDELRAII